MILPVDVKDLLVTSYKGKVVTQVLGGERWYDLMVWYNEKSRGDPAVINQTILDTPSKRKVALGQVAEVLDTIGPNTLNREHVEWRIVVFCNVQGRYRAGVVADIQEALAPVEHKLQKLPSNYCIEYGGQFEAQQEANQGLWVLGAVAGVFLLLYKGLGS